MDSEQREIMLRPALAWLVLLGLLALSCGYAFLTDAPIKLVVALGISAVMAAIIGGVLMDLRKASAIVLLAAFGGLAWLSLLFLFSFADFLTR